MKQLQFQFDEPEPDLDTLLDNGCGCIPFYGKDRTEEDPVEALAAQEPPRTYVVPYMSENPAVHFGMLRRWIRNFHKENHMDLPRGFYRRNKAQLTGMFYGMLDTYKIKVEDIIERQYS